MKQIDIREGARRQHRSIALFAVIQCWLRGLDGVGFSRNHLERLLGLVRFKATRVDWLREDFRDFFPYQWSNTFRKQPRSFASLIVARVPFEDYLPGGVRTLEQRIGGIEAYAKETLELDEYPKLGVFEMWDEPTKTLAHSFEGLMPFMADKANFDERLLSSYLALLAQGQISPKSLPPLKAPKTIWRIRPGKGFRKGTVAR